MPRNPTFDLFELLCVELSRRESTQVIDESNLSDDALIEDLKRSFRITDSARAFEEGITAIARHFSEKQAKLPFEYDLATRQFTPIDQDYLEFIAFAHEYRSVGAAAAKEFETRTLHRLRMRVTGDLRCIGDKRKTFRRKREIVPYLRKLGFDKNVLASRDGDGGLDILWLLPLGTIPLRPILSVQCKNSPFDESEANSSAGRAQRTLHRHSHIRCEAIKFVVFNDYVEASQFVGRAVGWIFLPLGLTDLASAIELNSYEIL
ncbi:MAG: hypothetical protein IMZ54_11805 [Acidobacteria bacterium]|nr:hypothetical protein [Acidobacteriota bacterium]